MARRIGTDSLPVVLHRFSNGVEVVKCVVEFCNEVAVLERSYSESLHRLLRSSSYTFHSNLLFQWLGNEPYEEIGSLKHSWQELGLELSKLADLHSEQAEAYQNTVRKPLTELLPQLEEARRAMRVKTLQIKSNLDPAYKKMNKERQKYLGVAECCERLQTQIRSMQSAGVTSSIRLSRLEKRLDSTEKQLLEQEKIYHTSHGHYLQAMKECDDEIQELYEKHHEREITRVNALKEALLGFTKVLSNTAPAYLEGMQRIQFSVDTIDAASDIQCFVNEHRDLQTPPQPPHLEKHTFVRDTPKDLSGSEGGRQSPIGGPGGEEEEGEEGRAWQDYKREGSEPSGSESMPSSSISGQLSGSQASRLETSGAGLGGRTQGEKPDAKTSMSSLKEDSEHKTTSTEGKPQRRKWPLEGLWGGIKERLRPTESKEGEREGNSDAAEAGDNSNSGQDVSEEETHDVGAKKYSELVAREEVISASVLGGERETEEEERREIEEQVERRRGKSRKRPQSHRVSSIVQAIENTEESGGNSSVGSRRDGDRAYQPPATTHSGRVRASRPSPNPKPANLKITPGKGPGTSNSDRVSSSELSRPGASDKLQRPPQPKTRLHNTTQPQIRTTREQRTDSQPITHSQVTPNPAQPHAINEQLATTTITDAANLARTRHNVRVDAVHISDPNIHQLLTRLQQQASENDYYQLLGVDPSVSGDELARVRREKSRQLHPDHFANQPERQERAQQQLMLINQVFQDVLKTIDTRALYNQLCDFRKHYSRIPDQKQRGLGVAHSKLESLHKQLKKHRAPLALLSELQTALELITVCMNSGGYS